jgi:hypothetical protein
LRFNFFRSPVFIFATSLVVFVVRY